MRKSPGVCKFAKQLRSEMAARGRCSDRAWMARKNSLVASQIRVIGGPPDVMRQRERARFVQNLGDRGPVCARNQWTAGTLVADHGQGAIIIKYETRAFA